MKSFLHWFYTHRSCCLNCGSFQVQPSGLCIWCEGRARDYQQKTPYQAPPYVVRALYEWSPGESDLLSRWILALKGERSQRAWASQAEIFAKKTIKDIPLGRRVLVVPAPSSKRGRKDHAYLWAEALAQALGAEMKPCLSKKTSQHQRGGSRGERALIEMEMNEITTGSEAFSPSPLIIFADDVLTSGSTARAAYKALGSPPHFEVWVFARRSLSCGASKDLL